MTSSPPESRASASRGATRPALFVGFPYREPYEARYGTTAVSAIRESGWEPVMPLGEVPRGLLLERIVAMIRGAERAVYEVGTENGNVWFEMGVSIALRQPTALMSDQEPKKLAGFLRSPWLHHYANEDACLAALRGFLDLEGPEPHVPPAQVPGDPALVVVVGVGDRTRVLADALRAAGKPVAHRQPDTIRSLKDAVELAESCGVLACVRPDTEEWDGHDAIAALVTLGAAFGSRRAAIVAAGQDEPVPSDCEQLLVHGADDASLAANVLTLIDQPPLVLTPSGTARPRVDPAIPRPLRTPVADALRTQGRALLSAEPGYGKTTLLDQVAADFGSPTAWVTIAANWSTAEVVERIVTAVGQHVPSFGWSAWVAVRRSQQAAERANDRVSGPPTPHPIQLAELLATDEAPLVPQSVLLVVDDVHKSTDDGAQFLTRLAQIGPPWLRIAFAGRGAPAGLLSETAAGRLSTWGAEELQFSRDETHAYLRQSVVDLDDERADLLYERSQGWPAALAVIRAWLAAHEDATFETLVEMTRGDRHQIYQVFATDYFAQLPDPIRHDLLVTSLPVSLDATVAQHLLGVDGGMRLRTLVDGPYFLVEDEAGTFRLHSLFREFLSQRWIDERGLASLQAARSSLARWYQENNDAASAYQIACEAENWEVAVAVVGPFARAFANRGEAGFVRELLGHVPVDRIHENWPVWESWVRALVYTGAPDALDEARALAAADAPSVVDHAVAALLLVQLQHDLGQVTDQAMADACGRIAAQLRDHDVQLHLSARLLSLDARSTHSADPAEWPGFTAEASRLIDEAEAADALAVAAGACATAADFANRSAEDQLRSENLELRVNESFGRDIPLLVRAERARHFISLFNDVVDLFRRAFRLAEEAEAPLIVAEVQIRYARFLVYNSAMAAIRAGAIDDDVRERLESALGFATHAARAYSSLGIPRGVVTALNAAAEAASALGDRTGCDEFTREASGIAEQYGYDDLAASAARIREKPTVLDQTERAQAPLHHLSPAQLDESIEKMIRVTRIDPSMADRVRPLLQRELFDLATLDATREEVCQYLALLRNLTGPKIGPFLAELNWSVTCRMRGLSSVSHQEHAEPLLRQFTAAVCTSCEFRSPGVAANDQGSELEDIYAPLFERLPEFRREAGGSG